MLGNGNANNSEVGKGKKAMVSLSAIPAAGLVVEGYADFDDHPNGKRRMTFQGFAGLELEKIRFGLQYAHQFRRQGRGLDDMSLRILSVFSVARLSGQVNAIVRLDRMFDPNPDGATISYIPFDPNTSFNFLLVGLDINAGENVRIVPNVESVFYDAGKTGKKPTTDIIPRMTVVVTF